MPRGLFVSYAGFVPNAPGGVQTCTREYIDAIRAAGIDIKVLTFDVDRSLAARTRRLMDSSPYTRPAPQSLVEDIRRELRSGPADFVFLNQVALAALAPQIRPLLSPGALMVLLSHGMESTDLLHLIRLRKALPLSGRTRPSADIAMGRVIRAEAASRAAIDAVVCLSPFDVELEHWMSPRPAEWLPRVVVPKPLKWKPDPQRLGFVGTLDHAPNLEGLVLALDAMARLTETPPRVRVVGGPRRIGEWVSRRHGFVDFLGALDEDRLPEEAATWSAFLHPIFCHPRGCSTKLATALGWQIPIVTTAPGRRGYQWGEGALREGDTPEAFALCALSLLDASAAAAARAEVVRVARTSPTLKDVAARLSQFIKAVASS